MFHKWIQIISNNWITFTITKSFAWVEEVKPVENEERSKLKLQKTAIGRRSDNLINSNNKAASLYLYQ